MKIIYIANVRVPTEKAHGLQIIKMCNAFANQGVDLELIVPRRKNYINQDVFSYYDISSNFKITYIWNIDTVRYGHLGLFLQIITFSLSSLWHVRRESDSIFFTRDLFFSFFSGLIGKKVVLEIHDLFTTRFAILKFLLKPIYRFISTNQWKKKIMLRKLGLQDQSILVAPNGFSANLFLDLPSQSELRTLLKLPLKKKIVVYTGGLMKWKGVDIFAQSIEYLGEDIIILIIASAGNVEEFRHKYKHSNIYIYEKVPHVDVPLYLCVADILVLPNIPITYESVYTTSPIKLFEYMASGTPIVASDLPSIREIVNKETAILIQPNNARILAEAINDILEHPLHAKRRAQKAFSDVQEFSWEKRAIKILSFIK